MAAAGASATSTISRSFTKDDKVKFLRTIKEIAENNVPVTKIITFENKLSESGINWINAQMEIMIEMFDAFMYTFNLEHSFDESDNKSVVVKCSEKIPENKPIWVCEDIDHFIEHIDDPPYTSIKVPPSSLKANASVLTIEPLLSTLNNIDSIMNNFEKLVHAQQQEIEKLKKSF